MMRLVALLLLPAVAGAQLQGTPVVRYYFDEATSGTSPTAVQDHSGNDYDLTEINYGSGNLAYTEISTNAGLESTATSGTQRARRTIDDTSDALRDALVGSNQITIELVLRLDAISGSTGRIFAIQDRVGNGATFGLYSVNTSNISLAWNGSLGGSWGIDWSSRVVVHVVIDSPNATSADRQRLYVNGSIQTVGTQGVTQNSTLSVGSGHDLIAFNRESSGSWDRSWDGVLFYAAIYDAALDTSQISNNVTELADDDTPAAGSGELLLRRRRN